MKKRHFTKIELKIIKYKLMKRGMTEEQAGVEIQGMIDCVESNYEIEEQRKKEQEKRYKHGGHRR